MINFKRYKCYYDHEHCLEDISHIWQICLIESVSCIEGNNAIVQILIRLRTLLGGYKSARVYFLFPWLLLKSHNPSTFFLISRQIRVHTTRFWKVLRQINPYVWNKWPLKLPCAYLNTQQSSRN
ncbi:hypothetical protein T09_4368, partial [Trichinella sp. T9]